MTTFLGALAVIVLSFAGLVPLGRALREWSGMSGRQIVEGAVS